MSHANEIIVGLIDENPSQTKQAIEDALMAKLADRLEIAREEIASSILDEKKKDKEEDLEKELETDATGQSFPNKEEEDEEDEDVEDDEEIDLKKKVKKEGLDPVGKEDGDVDNDGDSDSSDKYLKNRRRVIANKMKSR